MAQTVHDATNSESGFVSLIRNQTPKDQLRLNAQFRQDYFQVPYDPNPNDWEQETPPGGNPYYISYGLRDGQTERDSFVIANWVHTLSPKALFSFAPFYHFNQANYDSPSTDSPAATTWHQGSNYVGGQGDVHVDAGPNNFSGGMYTFYQAESDLFGVIDNTASPSTVYGPDPGHRRRRTRRGSTCLTTCAWASTSPCSAAMRFSSYHAGLNESATYPRIGATFEIPKLHWVLRGFYGHFFQPAPLETVSKSVLNYASQQPTGENTFTPLPSERDEEHQFGIQIPFRGWFLDVDTVKNRVNNFLDHSNLGESNMYFPIAVDGALVRAWEMTLRSPELAHLGQFHLTYSNQIAEQRGNIIGGFTCSIQGDPACTLGFNYTPVDHDQRQTLNTGFTANLPRTPGSPPMSTTAPASPMGCKEPAQSPYQGPYLPVHTTFDASAGPLLRRTLETLRQRHQRHKPPRPAGYINHHRRLSLQRSADVLGRVALRFHFLGSLRLQRRTLDSRGSPLAVLQGTLDVCSWRSC